MEPTGMNEVTKPTHPKAVGGVLKHLAQQSIKHHVQPQSPTPSRVAIFTSVEPRKKQKWQPPNYVKNAFVCELCDVRCTGPDHLQHHLVGKRHKKNVQKINGEDQPEENSNLEAKASQQPVAKIQSSMHILAQREPILGLEFVTEVVNEDYEVYHCGLCHINVATVSIEAHLIGSRHRKKHMEKFHPQRYEKTPWVIKKDKGKVISTAMREYAKDVSQFSNGAYNIGKVKVVNAKIGGPSSDDRMTEKPPVKHKVIKTETNLSVEKTQRELEIEERERVVKEKERILQEEREQQIQETIEAKMRERKRLLWEKEEREKREKELEEKRQEEEKQRSRENLLDMICKNEKEKMLLKLQEKEEASGYVKESMVTDALIQDANDRNAQREVELILNLSSSDRKILYLLMLQRKRFKTSLKKLEEIIGDKPITENERIIKTRLETALEKMKSDARQILSTALWNETDDNSHAGNQSRTVSRSPINSVKSGSSVVETFPSKTSEHRISPNRSSRRYEHSRSSSSSYSRTHSYDYGQSHGSRGNHDHREVGEQRRSRDEYSSSLHDSRVSREVFSRKRPESVERDDGQLKGINARYHQDSRLRDEKILQKSPDDAGPSHSDREKRKIMEDRIFESLCKGSLAPIAKAFSNNPTLQAALKTWEGSQRDISSGSSRDDDHAVKTHTHGDNSSYDAEVSLNFSYRQRRSDQQDRSWKSVEESYEHQAAHHDAAHSYYESCERHDSQRDSRDRYDDQVSPHTKYAHNTQEKSRLGYYDQFDDKSLRDRNAHEPVIETDHEKHEDQHPLDEWDKPGEAEEYYDETKSRMQSLREIGLYDDHYESPEFDQKSHFHGYTKEQPQTSTLKKVLLRKKTLLPAPRPTIPFLERDDENGNGVQEKVVLLGRRPPQQFFRRKRLQAPSQYSQPGVSKKLPNKKTLLETPETETRRTLLQHPVKHHHPLPLKRPPLSDRYPVAPIHHHPLVKVSQRPAVPKVPLLASPSVRPKQSLLRHPSVGIPRAHPIPTPSLLGTYPSAKRKVPLLQSPAVLIPVKKPLLSRPPPLLQDPE